MTHRFTLARAAALAALLSAPFLAGCAREATPPPAEAAEPVAVRTVAPGAGEAAALVLPGRVRAREEVTLTARLAARLTRLPRREGQHFRAGEVLARFDAPETREGGAAAREALRAAMLHREVALRQESRMDSLFAAGVVARRDLELAQAARRSAEAEWAAARAGAAQWASGTSLTAPFDGVVVRRHVDEGSQVGVGQPVLDLRSDAAGEIEVPVPESALDVAQAARVAFQAGEGAWRPAVLARLDGMTDYATRTRTAHLRAADGAPLEPGAYVRVRFEAPAGAVAPAALTVPAASLVRRGALAGVYVVRDGRAELRWLKLGDADGAQVAVLAGLLPGERIAATPRGLADGRAVKVAP